MRKTKKQLLKTKQTETLKKRKRVDPKFCVLRIELLLGKYGEDPRATVDETVRRLISHFVSLKVAKTTFYEFMIKDCASIMKKAHFESKERNSEKKY